MTDDIINTIVSTVIVSGIAGWIGIGGYVIYLTLRGKKKK